MTKQDHKRPLGDGELAALLGQLAMAAGAGMALQDGLRAAARGFPEYQARIEAVSKAIDGGEYPETALEQSGLLPGYDCGLAGAALAAGRADTAFAAMAAYHKKSAALKQAMLSAAMQPLAMLAISAIITIFTAVRILPAFDAVYASMGASMTGPAAAMLAMGRWLSAAGPWIGGAFLVSAAIAILVMKIPALRDAFSKYAGRFLENRRISRQLDTARYLQSMSMGLDSGLTAAEAAAYACGLYATGTKARERADAARAALDMGAAVHEALEANGYAEGLDARMLETAAAAGRLPDAMRELSDTAMERAEAAMDGMAGSLEPIVTAIGAALIGATIAAAMLPLLGVMASL